MKLFFFVALLLISLSISAQPQKDYKIDDNLTIVLPDNLVRHDTLGVGIITAKSKFGQFLVIITPLIGRNQIKLANTNDLNDCYQGIKAGAMEQTHGTLLSEKTIEQKKIKITTFIIRETFNGRECLAKYLGLILNKKMTLIKLVISDEKTSNEPDLLSLLKLSGNLGPKNQLETNEVAVIATDALHNGGYAFGYYIVGPLLLIGFIVFIIKALRKTRPVLTHTDKGL